MPAVIDSGESSNIRVVVLNTNRDMRIVKKKYKENRCQMDKAKNWEVTFKGSQIGRVWVRVAPTFRHKYMPAIFVREGSNSAVDLENKDDFIPPLTQKENVEMIKYKMAQAKAKGKLLTTGQFIVIVAALGILIALAIANMAGIHIGVQTIVQNATSTVPSV